jgi:hypothetical protein
MSPQMFDEIPFQLFNRKMAERKTRPVNKDGNFPPPECYELVTTVVGDNRSGECSSQRLHEQQRL